MTDPPRSGADDQVDGPTTGPVPPSADDTPPSAEPTAEPSTRPVAEATGQAAAEATSEPESGPSERAASPQPGVETFRAPHQPSSAPDAYRSAHTYAPPQPYSPPQSYSAPQSYSPPQPYSPPPPYSPPQPYSPATPSPSPQSYGPPPSQSYGAQQHGVRPTSYHQQSTGQQQPNQQPTYGLGTPSQSAYVDYGGQPGPAFQSGVGYGYTQPTSYSQPTSQQPVVVGPPGQVQQGFSGSTSYVRGDRGYGDHQQGWTTQPPKRQLKPRLILGMLALLAVLVATGIVLWVSPGVLKQDVLDKQRVAIDVSAQYQKEFQTVIENFRCDKDELVIEKGDSYKCSAVTKAGDPVSITITIQNENGAYTWKDDAQ